MSFRLGAWVVRVAIGPYWFPTKHAAKEKVRSILNTTPLGNFLQGDDFSMIRHLLNNHPSADVKVGPGVLALSVDRNEMATRSFWVHRVDGTVVDFSYLQALNGKPNHRQEVLTAMRWEIDDQIIAFRDWYFAEHEDQWGRVLCPLTGVFVTRYEAHIDHVIRFVDLADYFINWAGGYSNVEYEGAGIGARSWLKDRHLGVIWQNWHSQNAQLRAVECKANIARNRKVSDD